MDEKAIKNICSFLISGVRAMAVVLAKGDRVELIPVKDGIKIIHIKREEVKPN